MIVNNASEPALGWIHQAAPVKNGGILQESRLADALVPGYLKDSSWLFLREMLSGLWFLRKVGDLRRDGLEIAADGYGRQLYLDFRYEEETPDGLWARVAESLNGGGCVDPDDLASELRLAPLRAALSSLISAEWVKSASASLEKGKRPDWPEHTAEIREVFVRHRTIFNNSAPAGPDGPETAAGVEDADILSEYSRTAEKAIRRYLKVYARYRRTFAFGARLFRKSVNRHFPNQNGLTEEPVLALNAVLIPLTGCVAKLAGEHRAELGRTWGLERWLWTTGIAEEGESLPSRLNAVLASAASLEPDSESRRDPGTLLSDLMSESAFREVCGVNSWDGILWFGEESWNQSVRSIMLSCGQSPRRHLRRIMRCWEKAASVSEFKLDSLLKAALR